MGAPLLAPNQAEQDFLGFAAQENLAPEHRAAFDRFAAAGLPGRRVEAWHYTDLRAKLRAAPPLAPHPDAADISAARGKVAVSDTLKIVTLDGFFIRELSDDLAAVPGLILRGLHEDDAAFLHGFNARDPLLDLNAAFARGGFVVEVAAGARIEKTLEIVALAADEGAASRFGRGLVLLGPGAGARLLETRAEAADGFGDSALFVELGQGAELDFACRCAVSAPVETQTFVARLEFGAQLRASALIAGSTFLRRQMFVSCAGPDARVELSGATLLKGREHADTTLVLRHDAPSCFSRETFKYVLAGEANGVFQGKITVPPHAQKTDGKMMCRALLLEDGAAMSAKPELEIFADDVACGHGSAIAKIDPAQIFYMESRGIPQAVAQSMLIEAFAAEAFDSLADEAMRDLLRGNLSDLLAGGAFA